MDLYKFYKWTEVQFFNLYGERDGEGEGSLAKENKERVFIRGGGKHNNAIQFFLFWISKPIETSPFMVFGADENPNSVPCKTKNKLPWVFLA